MLVRLAATAAAYWPSASPASPRVQPPGAKTCESRNSAVSALAAEAKIRLARVGLDRVAGQLADPASVFADQPELAQRSSRLTIGQLTERQGQEPGLQLVDVRSAAETAGGTIPGAVEIPLAVLADSLDGLDRNLPVVAYCASGYRSVVAASRLAAAGFRDVSDLLGGYVAWQAAGLPLT